MRLRADILHGTGKLSNKLKSLSEGGTKICNFFKTLNLGRRPNFQIKVFYSFFFHLLHVNINDLKDIRENILKSKRLVRATLLV